MTYTERVQRLAEDLGVEFSVALDIDYLHCLERRIVQAAHENPKLRDFDVQHPRLERQLEKLGV